jgi:hypothetical protein
MENEPYNEYLLIMPSGNCKGFNDLEGAKSYINNYYEWKYDDVIHRDGYNDGTDIGGNNPRLNVFTQLGVYEGGKCEVYRTQEFIKKLDEDLVFDEDKEEIISKLSQAKIDFNIYDYSLDKILADVQEINVMEIYGEVKG